MKQLKKLQDYVTKFISLNLFLLAVTLTGFIANSNAQSNPCGCTPVSTVKWLILVTECPPPPCAPAFDDTECGYTDPNGNWVACSIQSSVIIEYLEVTCGSNTAIMFRSARFSGSKYASP
ncbi:MAG: hypothetical protein Q8M15_04570 [Bacteroidota bacterium]|nr:hypothetical protein [Bacteroidota bacterium]